MADSYSNLAMILSSTRKRGLWAGLNLAVILAKQAIRKWFGHHRTVVSRLFFIAILAISAWLMYVALRQAGAIAVAGDVAQAIVVLALALSGVAVSIGQLALQSVYRRQVWLRTIQFMVFGLFVAGIGDLSYDKWSLLYRANPAAASLLGVAVAVVLFGFKSVIEWFPRAILIKNMAVGDVSELADLSEDGKRRAAVHEAGHALCYGLCTAVPEDAFVSIDVSMNDLIGGMVALPTPREPTDFTRPHVEWQMMMTMAGVAAEKVVFGEDSILGAGDMNGFTRFADCYLLSGHGEIVVMDADNELDVAANRAAVARLREVWRAKAVEFVQMNGALCEDLAQEIAETEFMDCERIAYYAARVAKPTGWDLIRWPESLPVYRAEGGAGKDCGV